MRALHARQDMQDRKSSKTSTSQPAAAASYSLLVIRYSEVVAIRYLLFVIRKT
jgi:hypothetical protein